MYGVKGRNESRTVGADMEKWGCTEQREYKGVVRKKMWKAKHQLLVC